MRARIPLLLLGLCVALRATAEPAATSARLSQASVESRRAQLYPQVTKFLSEAAALEPIDLVPRMIYPTEGQVPGWRNRDS